MPPHGRAARRTRRACAAPQAARTGSTWPALDRTTTTCGCGMYARRSARCFKPRWVLGQPRDAALTCPCCTGPVPAMPLLGRTLVCPSRLLPWSHIAARTAAAGVHRRRGVARQVAPIRSRAAAGGLHVQWVCSGASASSRGRRARDSGDIRAWQRQPELRRRLVQSRGGGRRRQPGCDRLLLRPAAAPLVVPPLTHLFALFRTENRI